MSTRATLALLALAALLGAAALLVQGPWATDRVREHEPLLPGVTAGEVRVVRIARGGVEVALTREGNDGWTTGPEKAPADSAAVEALLADLAGAEVVAVVSNNPAKQAEYETDAERGIAVRLEGEGGRVVAAFTVGRRGPDLQSAYVKRDGEREVLLASRDVRTPLARPAGNWKAPAEPAQ